MIHPPLDLTLTRTAMATGHQCGSGGSAPKRRAWPAAQHQLLQTLVTKVLLGCLDSILRVVLDLV